MLRLPKQGQPPAPFLVPFQLNYKDLDNERNYNLSQSSLSVPQYSDRSDNSIADVEVDESSEKVQNLEYMQRLLSILRKVPPVERSCKIIAAKTHSDDPSHVCIHFKSMVDWN